MPASVPASPASDSPAARWRGHVLIALITVNFLVAGLGMTLGRRIPLGDEPFYLELALSLREHGRFVQSGINPFRVTDGLNPPHANRSPLYPALLAPIASRTPGFFWQAKLLTLVLCCSVFPLLYYGTVPRWGQDVALLATFLLSLNASFIMNAGAVYVDALMIVMIFAVVWTAEGAFLQQRGYLFLGLTVALAFLAKASVLVLVPPLLLGLWLVREPVRLRVRHAGYTALVMVVVASPWLIRNWHLFGEPLYNVNSKTFWMNGWDLPDEGYYRPCDDGNVPGPRSYLATHSPQAAACRLGKGLLELGLRLDQAMGLAAPSRLQLDNLSGIGLLLLGVWGVWKDQVRPRRAFMLSTLGLFLLAYSWYTPIANPARFMAVLAPYLLLYAGVVMMPRLRLWGQTNWGRATGIGAVVLLVALAQMASWRGVTRDAWGSPMAASDRLFLQQLLARTSPGEPIVTEPGHGVPYLYLTDRSGQWLPSYRSLDRSTAWLTAHRIHTVVLSPELWQLRDYALKPYITRDAPGTLRAHRDPPGWKLVLGAHEQPARYLVYQLGRPPLPPGLAARPTSP